MNWFSYTFKKSSFFRFVFFVLVMLISTVVLMVILGSLSEKPHIENIFPTVIEPGELVTITGENFGKADEIRGLQLSDDTLSASDCELWGDKKIVFYIPKNFKTSLLAVYIGNNFSKKFVLTSRDETPKVIQKQLLVSLPEINSVSTDNGIIGQSITIYGKNFGASRQNSKVIFTDNLDPLIEDASNLDGAYCNEADDDFVNWSDTEITIHIPDGAISGSMVVQTSAGLSNFVPFRVSTNIGKKTLSNKRNITLLLSASVKDINPNTKQNTFFLLVPQPVESYSQKNIRLLETENEPFARNFQNSTVYRFEKLAEESEISVTEKISLQTYDVSVNVNPKNIPAKIRKPEIEKYKNSRIEIPSDNAEIRDLVAKITARSSNPYNNAKKVFDYILKNISVTKRGLNDSPDILNCLKTELADAYELSLIFCTLLRACDIPCIQISGIICDKYQNTHLHWWNEFYIEGVGWIPVDTALAMGEPFILEKKPDEFFANLDGLHIAFSRDKQMQSQMLFESLLINKTKSYANRQIWEESIGLESYNSFWNIPKIISIY